MRIKNILKRSVAMLLVLLTLFTSYGSSLTALAAVSAGDTNIKVIYTNRVDTYGDAPGVDSGPVYPAGGQFKYYWHYTDGNYSSYRFLHTAKSDGSLDTVCYCIEYGADFATSSTYDEAETITESSYWKNLSVDAQEGIKLAALYGYPINNFGLADCDAYAATQAVIWEFQAGYRTFKDDTYTKTDRDGRAIWQTGTEYPNAGINGKPADTGYNALIALIENHNVIPSFSYDTRQNANNNPLVLTYNSSTGTWTGSVTDTNGIWSEFGNVHMSTTNKSRLTYTTSGNKVTFTATAPFVLSDGSETNNFCVQWDKMTIPTSADNGLVLNDSQSQRVLYGNMADPVAMYLTIQLEDVPDESYVTLKKVNEAGDSVGGATYGVWGSVRAVGDDSLKLGTFTTDSTGYGSLKLDGIAIGSTVYIQEMSLDADGASKYKVGTNVFTVTTTAAVDKTNAAVDTEEWLDGYFELKKVDGEGEPLSGVEFTAYTDAACNTVAKYADGTSIVLTTGDDGSAKSNAIEVEDDGDTLLYIKETEAKDGTYQILPVVYDVTITPGNTTKVNGGDGIPNIRKYAKLDLIKDDDFENLMEGVVFRVFDDKDCTVRTKDTSGTAITLTTDDEGYAISGEIEVDETTGKRTVYVQEYSLPSAYKTSHQISTVPKEVELSAGSTTRVEFTNPPNPVKIDVIKEADDGEPLSGVQFTVYNTEAGAEAGTTSDIATDKAGNKIILTTNGDGYAISGDIAVLDKSLERTFYVKETYSPYTARYEMDTTVYEVKVTAGNTGHVNGGEAVINHSIGAKFTIHKTSASGKNLAGIVFYVYDDEACTIRTKDVSGNVISMTTGSDGKVTSPSIKITNDSGSRVVYIKEISMPADIAKTYEMSDEETKVTISSTYTSTPVYTVENYPKPGYFSVQKIDNAGNNLEGVKFTAYNTEAGAKNNTASDIAKDINGNNIVLTTNASGYAISGEIEVDPTSETETLYIKETYSPYTATHNMSTNVVEVTISAGGTYVVPPSETTNTIKPGNLYVKKIDSTGNPLAGVEFTVYNSADCKSTDIVKDVNGNNVVITTGSDGIATSANIKIESLDGREVYVKETKLPDNLRLKYEMDTTPAKVILEPGKTVLGKSTSATAGSNGEFVNKWLPGQFTIHKVDNTGNNLAGIKFTAYSNEACTVALKDVNGNNIVLTTDSSGNATSAEIPVDEGVHDSNGQRTVWIKETYMPDSIAATHNGTTEKYKITVYAGSLNPYDEDIINEWKDAKVSLVKEDDTGNRLEGVQFTAYNSPECKDSDVVKGKNGNAVVLTTKDDGSAISDWISVVEGNYTKNGERTIYLKETYIPPELAFRYEMNETPIEVVLQASKTTNANNGAAIINEWKYAKFDLIKVDDADNELKDVTFTAYTDVTCTDIVKDVDGNNVVVTTNDAGYAISTDIKILDASGTRTIWLKETSLGSNSATHEMNTTPIEVLLKAGETTSIGPVENPQKPGTFYIYKEDGDGLPLEGIKFTAYTNPECTSVLKDVNGNNVVLTTDPNGYAESTEIEIGTADMTRTIYIKETYVPEYIDRIIKISDKVYDVALKAGSRVKYGTIINPIYEYKTQFELYKKNENGDPLAGIKFTAYTDANCTTVAKDINGNNVVLTTNSNGYAKSTVIAYDATLDYQRLYLKETFVPDSLKALYKTNNKTYTVDIVVGSVARVKGEGTDAHTSIINEWKDATLTLHKIETWYDKPLAGVTFGVYSDEDCTNLIKSFETDANGDGEAADIEVNANGKRTVYVKEISTSDDKLYELNKTVYTVALSAGKNTEVNNGTDIPNDPVLHEIKIKKIDSETGNGLAGYKVEIYDAVKGKVATLTTGSNGVSGSAKLPAGTYTYKEIAAPAGYHIDSNTYSFTIKKDKTVTGNVKLANDGVTISVGTANVPATLLASDKPLTITLNKMDDTQPNTPVEGAEIRITQVSTSILDLSNANPSNLLANNSISNPYTDTQYTDENGDVTFTRMPAGTYVYQETAAAPGYHLTNVIYAFTISANNNVITGTTDFTNTPVETVITKTDLCTSEPVPGAEIVIYDEDGNEVWRETTDDDGTITALALKPGNYTFKETINPDGYKLNPNTFEFTIGEDSLVESGVTEFTDEPTEVIIYKQDSENNDLLAGCEVVVFDAAGTLVRTGTTGTDGSVKFQYLAPGDYTFKEKTPPVGYTINESVYKFTIKADGSFEGDDTIVNDPTVVILEKQDVDDGTLLPGAIIEVYDANGDVVATETTGNDGTITVKRLPVGEYTFKEIKAPVGYALNGATYKFEIDIHGNVTGHTMITDKKIQVTITKYDLTTGDPLGDTVIAIYDADGNEIAKETTDDATGSFTIYKVTPGTYTFKEISAPVGYGKNPGTYTFVVDEYGFVSGAISLVNKPTEVTIKKIDGKTELPLAGATIAIYDKDNNKVAEEITDAAGEITVYSLPVGTYTYKETKAPVGYGRNTATFTFTIDEFGVAHGDEILINKPTEVVITKTDLTDAAPVPGAEVVIYNADGDEVFRDVTDEDGTISTFYLPVGDYSFEETVAPSTYQLNTNTFNFTINEDGSITGPVSFSDAPTEVTITKTDLTTSEPVPGATVVIYNKYHEEVFSDVTDENGQITAFYLPHGEYTFEETIAPSTYQLNTNSFKFTIKEDGSIEGDTEFTDEPTEVTITKTDLTTAEPVPGAEVTIYNADGDEVFSDVTDDDGTVTAFYLPHGTYTFKETIAASTYKLNTNTFEFTINNDGSITGVTDFADEPTEVTITKTDLVDSAPVPGATVAIYNAEGEEVYSDVTDEKGQITAFYLPHGEYTFKETLAPSTYQLNPNTIEFTINDDGSVTGVTEFTDEPTEVTITKTDLTTAEPVPGATIVIYDENGEEVFTDVTDDDGTVTAFYLPHGEYTFEETIAPSTYQRNTNTFEFTINSDGSVTGVTDFTDKPTEVTISKVDVFNNQPIAGASVNIYDADGEIVFTGTTGADGKVTAFYLPHGEYTYEECVAPSPYQLNLTTFSFKIDDDGVTSGELLMTEEPTDILLNKVDAETGEPLANAEITIYDVSGSDVVTLTTGTDGTATYQYLPHGKYTYKETKAPEGYVLSETEYNFLIDENGVFHGDNTIPNTKIYGEIEIGKADAEDDELMLPNATFDIINADGKVVATVVTDENGIATVTDIQYGDYTIVETKAPEGYNINLSAYPVSIVTDGETVRVDVRDSVIQGSIEIAKKNATTHEPVANAEFEVIDSEGNVVETIVTDKNGIATTSLLRYGNYTLHESKAPVDYIAGEDVEFSITEHGKVVQITYFENPIIQTGSVITNNTALTYLTLAGIMFLIAAGGVTAYSIFRKKNSVLG